jgi:hypothetical protein
MLDITRVLEVVRLEEVSDWDFEGKGKRGW